MPGAIGDWPLILKLVSGGDGIRPHVGRPVHGRTNRWIRINKERCAGGPFAKSLPTRGKADDKRSAVVTQRAVAIQFVGERAGRPGPRFLPWQPFASLGRGARLLDVFSPELLE